MEGTLAMIIPWAANFAPVNWAICDGSKLSISDFQALYSLLGTTFGGDGRTYFQLPDLRGHVPMGADGTTQPGQSVTKTADGSGGMPVLATNYIICVNGIYPAKP